MTLPNFIAIGPGKTGTTWLYRCLLAHPQICMARHTKETDFFNIYYDRGFDWYEKFFDDCRNAKAIGEISNTYFFSNEAPARIAAKLPNVKLIVFLRDPVDRLISLYRFRLRNGLLRGPLEKAIAEHPVIVEQNFFDEHLQRYLAVFPREQIFVALFDDLKTDPAALLREVCKFLGVDPAIQPTSVRKQVLAARKPRNTRMFRYLKKVALWLRHNDLHRVLTWAKTNPAVLKTLTASVAPGDQPLSPELRHRLLELYKPHIARTSAMIGRDLSHWMKD